MRQAGRYMTEYRRLRKKYSLLELCRNPDLATEVTLQPIRRFDLDAAIIFADILLLLPMMGVDFEFSAGEGPRIHHPIRCPRDVERLRTGEPEGELSFVYEAIRQVRAELDSGTPLIGFAGGPFTVASYMIEGGYSRTFRLTKELMYGDSQTWTALMDLLTEVTCRYLRAQVGAGAQALQLFDSWVGALSPADYRTYVLPFSQRIFESLADRPVPKIHFGTGTSGFLDLMRKAGGTVQSVDWRAPLDRAWEQIGFDSGIQGNLDPMAMFAPAELLRERVKLILGQAGARRGHIFNLGHGLLPGTPVEHVEMVIDWVHGHPLDGTGAKAE
jgi:uroporphyrinogen decarboxylase